MPSRNIQASNTTIGWNSYLSWLNSLQQNKKTEATPSQAVDEKKNVIEAVADIAKEEV